MKLIVSNTQSLFIICDHKKTGPNRPVFLNLTCGRPVLFGIARTTHGFAGSGCQMPHFGNPPLHLRPYAGEMLKIFHGKNYKKYLLV